MCRKDPIGVRVRSGDAALLDRLREPTGSGSVHSVFTRVVNVLTPHGTLIALAARDGGDAPRTLVADIADWRGLGLAAGQSVTFAPGSIGLAVPSRPLLLTTTGARTWDPVTPSLAHLTPNDFKAAAVALDRLNHAYGARGGMLGATPDAGPMEAAVVRALHEGRTTLLAAVRLGDRPRIRRGILALLGLGPGLTPAGDDFLTGFALLAALPGSELAAFVPVLRDVLADHAGRTTDLGLATVGEAADGRARSELLDLLSLLANGHPPGDLHVPVRKVLAIGHTSGSDTLSGLVAGLHLEEELRGSL
ncbi:oxamate carbamoyltransferase subunit AllH family protein [Streptomyces sp. NPDC002520]